MNFGSKEPFWYLECVYCRSLQIETVPTDLSRHYPPDYLGSSQSSHLQSFNSIRQTILDFLKRQRTVYLLGGWTPVGWVANNRRPDAFAPHLSALRPLRPRKKARILDVGCGPGYLLYRLKEIGYENLIGQDPFQKWKLAGVRILDGQLDELSGQFDLIMLHHSLEHTPDPFQVLIKLKKLLAPDGCLLIRIPLAASEAWTQYSVHWYQIDAPRHLVIPSRSGIEVLVNRANLEISSVIFDSDETQFLCSEQYRRGISLRDTKSYYKKSGETPFDRSEIANAKARSREVNRSQMGDQACFYIQAPQQISAGR